MGVFHKLVFLVALQENSQNAPLVHATLETLLRFLNWIPLGYIFETKLISTLVYKVWTQFFVCNKMWLLSWNKP